MPKHKRSRSRDPEIDVIEVKVGGEMNVQGLHNCLLIALMR